MPAYQHLPVVILITLDREADKQRSLAFGTSEFLSKPPKMKAVVTMLQALLVE